MDLSYQQQNPYPVSGDLVAGKYRIDKVLGEGGMGAVLKAKNEITGQLVALKFMSPAVLSVSGAVDRFQNEARAAAMIDSPHVVKIHDVVAQPNGAPVIVMEFLIGRDLAAILEKEGTPGLPVNRAIHFLVQTLRGLGAAHDKGIIHRDMKPSNCFIVEVDGDEDFVKLVDFGISKVSKEGGPSLTRTNSALGTPLYMSPEQHRSAKDVDFRTDIYACGSILYEILTGRTPHISETNEYAEIILKIFTADPEPIRNLRPDVPEGLAQAIHRCIAREKEARPGSAYEMIEMIAPYADHRTHHVLDRIRKAERRAGRASMVGSQPPPGFQSAPGIPTGAAVGAPTTRGPATPAFARTHALVGSTPPPGPGVRGPDGAGAPVGPVGAVGPNGRSTDLGAARDASVAKAKPPLAAIAVGALVLIVGGTAVALRLSGGKPDGASAATSASASADPAGLVTAAVTGSGAAPDSTADAATTAAASAPKASASAGRTATVSPPTARPPAPKNVPPLGSGPPEIQLQH